MKIDHTVKMPNSYRASGWRFAIPWDQMKSGDSVFVPDVSHVDGRTTIYAQARRKNIKVVIRKEYDSNGSHIGLRVWVLENTSLVK